MDEELASKETVWVVNLNDDSGYDSLELLRRQDPEWGNGGGTVIVKPQHTIKTSLYGAATGVAEDAGDGTVPEDGESPVRTLLLKEFTMLRNYDSWFAGASEFFVKMGAVENFTASTEAELQLYSPSVTDFMVVVKRKQKGETIPFKVVLFSDWTDQVENCAFMITEDDGGKQTSWKCTAVVKISSKSYGIEVDLPFRTRDDIVWRGSLSSRYLDAHSNVPENFGDVTVTFEIEES